MYYLITILAALCFAVRVVLAGIVICVCAPFAFAFWACEKIVNGICGGLELTADFFKWAGRRREKMKVERIKARVAIIERKVAERHRAAVALAAVEGDVPYTPTDEEWGYTPAELDVLTDMARGYAVSGGYRGDDEPRRELYVYEITSTGERFYYAATDLDAAAVFHETINGGPLDAAQRLEPWVTLELFGAGWRKVKTAAHWSSDADPAGGYLGYKDSDPDANAVMRAALTDTDGIGIYNG